MAGPAPQVTAEAMPTLSVRQQWMIGLVLALSNFMVVLDLTIANVSVPHIAGNLGITLDQGTWVITSYAVAEAVCVPLTGWLTVRFGAVRVFAAALMGFGFFSLICGISPTLGVLVAARIGQGLFGAPLMPMSQTLMILVFPPQRRAKFMAVWAMTTILGPVLGPILGGWISDNMSWHWIFLINVPIAIGATLASVALMRGIRTATARAPIDAIGLALLIFWIGCLQIVLDTGRDVDWFASARIVALSSAAAIGFLVFIIWELTEEHPIVNLRIFRHRGFSASLFVMTIAYAAFLAGNVLVPQWLQSVQGYTAQDAGLVSASNGVAAILVAPIAGRLAGSPKVDLRWMVFAGLIWASFCFMLRAGWTTDSTMGDYALPIFLQGFSMPFFFIPLTSMVLQSVDLDETASGAGLQAFARTMGMAISTSVVLTYWGNEQRVVHNEIANTLAPNTLSDGVSATLGGIEAMRGYVNGLVDQQAFTVALDHASLWSTVSLILAAVVLWVAPRQRRWQAQGAQPVGH